MRAHVGPRAAMSRRTATSATAPAPSPAWRNRIVASGEEAPDQLLANPANWRIHPKAQQDALSGALDAVGWVQQVLVNRRSGFVVDGHARVALALSRGACEAFKAAAPRRHRRNAKTNLDHRIKGESYKIEVYEEAIGLAFERVAVSSTLRTSAVAEATRPDAEGGDVLAEARIKREREQAALRFAKDRDLGRLEATMARLDAEAQACSRPSVTGPDSGRGTGIPGVAAEPVGEDVGRWPPRDRRGRVRTDRRPWGDRLHVHADGPREGPRMGCSLRGWATLNEGRSGRGERVSAGTKYLPLVIPVTNVPSSLVREHTSA